MIYLQGFPLMSDIDRDKGLKFNPKFDSNGLMVAVITDAKNGQPLMVGFMNQAAIDKTLETKIVHFYSRSRQKLWKKGETSGHILSAIDIRIDCDQDALWISANPAGPTCHTGVQSCFYRRLKEDVLEMVE